MARNFKAYPISEFQAYIKNVSLKRKITHIQIHHTWKPRKSDYSGMRTIRGMWHYHTETRGWDDIGQHFSVSPDGLVWDGRQLEKDPAGIAGHNKGGIMFEIIGNFDKGEEQLEGKQLATVLAAVRMVMEKFKLGFDAIIFHREYAAKSCPGTGISKDWFIGQVKNERISYENAPAWKQEFIDWVFKEKLLEDEEWKRNIELGLPLWAEAIVLKRMYEKLK